MKINLLPRFLVIIVVAVVAGWMAFAHPPLLGTDLAGGTVLVYELDMSKAPDNGSTDLAARVIEVLKQRVDPSGVKGITWRVVEGKRIQIEMPHPSKEVIRAREARENAERDLKDVMWKQSEIEAAIQQAAKAATPAERKTILDSFIADRLPPSTDPAAKPRIEEAKMKGFAHLETLADAWRKFDSVRERVDKIKPADRLAEDLQAINEAQSAYSESLRTVLADSVDFNLLTNLMKAADSTENVEGRKELAALPDKYPLQKEKIDALIKAHQTELELSGEGVESPEELQRLVTRAGVLDFRVAVTSNEIGADRADASLSLQQRGPDQQVRANSTSARWFEIDSKAYDNFKETKKDAAGKEVRDPTGKVIRIWSTYYVIDLWAGKPYLLCYDDHDHTLTHIDSRRRAWSVSAGRPYNDPNSGGINLPFKLDPVGANYMGDLTSTNRGHPMTILLDDKAISAPNIQNTITDSGVITFGQPGPSHPIEAMLKEAELLKQIMDAGSLPATLQSEPISVENISPDMGQDNIDAGVRSAIIAIGAVIFFMFAYYTITGAFANIALMLNLVLVLAAMAVLRQPFTLPGIAGLVLTLGMAVDANVLINERIREEIHRGASLWMAIRQGYDRVFWTIFDSNLTTAFSAIVLIVVGTAEVRGFGVTLLIGLIIQLFTALYVTRTLMMAFVKWGIVRAIDDHSVAEYLREIVTLTWLRNGHWPFMRVVTVTNIDWIGMRRKFWVFSGIITVAGLVAFLARGNDKYDIEFRGGTQVTFQLKDPYSDIFQSLVSLSSDSKLTKAYPELRGLQDRLKTLPTDKRDAQIKALAEKLAHDQAVVKAHPEVGSFAQQIKRIEDPLFEIVASLEKISTDAQASAAYPELRDFPARLKTLSSEKRDAQVKEIARKVAKDPQVVQAFPEVKSFESQITAAEKQKTLSLDEVRAIISDLQKFPPLKELANARVYAVGNPADRRYQMQTTIANTPQNFETTLEGPLYTALGKSAFKELKIRHDLSATRADFTLQPAANGSFPTEEELRKNIRGMTALPGMKDLAAAEVTSIGKLSDHRIEVTIPNLGIRKILLEPLADAFKDYLEIKPRLAIKDGGIDNPADALDNKRLIMPITDATPTLKEVFATTPENADLPFRDVQRFRGGAAIILNDITPPISAEKLKQRISSIRRSSEFSAVPSRDFEVMPVTVLDSDGKPVQATGDNDVRPMVRGVLVTVDQSHLYEDTPDKIAQWRTKVAFTEWNILGKALAMEDLFEGVTSFDAVVASQAKFRALLAIVISLALIVIYVWVRFGGIRYGIGAILSLAHDAVVALAGTVLSGLVYNYLFNRHSYLNLMDFKINLTMIAAYLTVIGYSVNDTIVIFDRVRENRGKSRLPLTPKLINDAINQCFGRTIWTTFTVFIVVLIMYVWGGDGVRGFSFAMLIGVFTGAYSTLAIASPMLLATGTADSASRGPSPFTRKDEPKRVPQLPEANDIDVSDHRP